MATLRARGVAVLVVSACTFTGGKSLVPGDDAASGDAPPPADAFFPDAGTCVAADVGKPSCAGPGVLHECAAAGANPVVTECPWGCIDGAAPHCGELVPSGGAVTAMNLAPDPMLDVDIAVTASNAIIDTSSGLVTGIRQAGAAEYAGGVHFRIVNGVGVFRAKSWKLMTSISVRGANALALVATEDIEVRATLDASWRCSTSSFEDANPGGFAGGDEGQAGSGSGGGQAGTGNSQSCSGGGGGAHATAGGDSDESATGSTYGSPAIALLRGGAGGGGGGGGENGGDRPGVGGAGGGAVQLAANGRITFESGGAIQASGCGGGGGRQRCGGGGGAGGAILVEAHSIVLATGATLAANGGGGGGGAGSDGDAGALGAMPAAGGTGSGPGGAGAAANGDAEGEDAPDATRHGGGGGGLGWIRLNRSTLGTITLEGVTSPAAGNAFTQDVAATQ